MFQSDRKAANRTGTGGWGQFPRIIHCEPVRTGTEWIFLNRNRREPEPDLFFDPLICFEAINSIFFKAINAKCLRRLMRNV